jgi:hypothetical protein
MASRRWRALSLLCWFVAGTAIAPLLDGLLFHENAGPWQPHVESTSEGCHAERCSLDRVQSPTTASLAPLSVPEFDSLRVEPRRRLGQTGIIDSTPSHSLHSRAPPRIS